MSPTLRANPLPPAEDPDSEFHAAALNELIGLGMDIARRVHAATVAAAEPPANAEAEAEASGTPPPPSLPDCVAAFDRAARAVRRTVLLARHLRERPAAAPSHARARFLVRRDAIRALDDELERGARPRHERDALRREFIERLDSPETEADLLDLPTERVVSVIRRDLGMDTMGFPHLYKRRTPAEIRTLERLAAAEPVLAAAFARLDAEPPPEHPPELRGDSIPTSSPAALPRRPGREPPPSPPLSD